MEGPGLRTAPAAAEGRAGREGQRVGLARAGPRGRRRCSVMVPHGGERARPGARGGPAGAGPAREPRRTGRGFSRSGSSSR